MRGVSRVDLKGKKVCVELRQSVNRYFVTYPDLKQELVMAFEHRWSAFELAVNIYAGTPFYTMIPVVDYLTAYPRPWLVYPRTILIDVPFTITA